MSCNAPLPVAVGSFVSAAWTNVPIGPASVTDPVTGAVITANAGNVSVQFGAAAPNVVVGYTGYTNPSVYYTGYGTQYVLILIQATQAGSNNFCGVWLTNQGLVLSQSLLSPTILEPGTLPSVQYSPGGGTYVCIYCQVPVFGGTINVPIYIYGSDFGENLYSNTFTSADLPLEVICQSVNPTLLLLFKNAVNGVISGPNQVASISPPCASDFFVRDWTTSTSVFDEGAEPSASPGGDFYTTSDVWNLQVQDTTVLGGLPSIDAQPVSDNAAATDTNYAYTRISRKGMGLETTVNIEFFTYNFGAGGNFVSIGTTSVDYPAGSTTPVVNVGGFSWTAPAVSPHFCMAVQITAPNDAPTASLNTVAPATGAGTSLVVNDNNTAQRNMTVVLVMHPAPPIPPPIGPHIRINNFGIVHNPWLKTVDMTLRYKPSAEAQRNIPGLRIEVAGGKGQFMPTDNLITLPDMQPGESRWVSVSFLQPAGELHQQMKLYFELLADGKVVDGFAFGVEPSTVAEVIAANMNFQRSLFNRIIAEFEREKFAKYLAGRIKLLTGQEITDQNYPAALSVDAVHIKDAITHIIKAARLDDPLNLVKAYELYNQVVATGDVSAITAAHTSLLHTLDNHLSMMQLSRGNRADILQNIRWQQQLYSTVTALKGLKGTPVLLEKSEKFIKGFAKSKNGEGDFVKLILELLPQFEEAAKHFTKHSKELLGCIADMEKNAKDVTALQHAHRVYLLVLQTVG